MRVVMCEAYGGPESLVLKSVDSPRPGPSEVKVRLCARGVSYTDVLRVAGQYHVKTPPPFIPGGEAAGEIVELGSEVEGFNVGDRVLCGGGFAEETLQAASSVIKLPETVGFEAAAASLLKGMTTEFLLRRCYPVKAGETILVHAAAGGVGTLMVQWAKALGAIVIGTVGSEAKAELARSLGCDHVILYRHEDVAARVREITGGVGVPVAYDSVGKDTFEGTLGSLARRGLFVTFGNASGPVPAFEPARLQRAGSLFLTRPTLVDYIATPEELDASAGALFGMIAVGKLRIEIGQRFKLAEARKAHEALERRETIGASLLIP